MRDSTHVTFSPSHTLSALPPSNIAADYSLTPTKKSLATRPLGGSLQNTPTRRFIHRQTHAFHSLDNPPYPPPEGAYSPQSPSPSHPFPLPAGRPNPHQSPHRVRQMASRGRRAHSNSPSRAPGVGRSGSIPDNYGGLGGPSRKPKAPVAANGGGKTQVRT